MTRPYFFPLRKVLGIVLIASWTATSAQPPQAPSTPEKQRPSPEEIERHRIEYVIRHLNVSQDTLARFRPVYTKYRMQLLNIYKERRQILRTLKEARQNHSLTEAQAKQILTRWLELQRQEQAIRNQYLGSELPAIISYRRVLQVMRLERRFNREVLRRWRQQQRAQPPGQ